MSSTPPDPDILPRSAVEAWRADTASISELREGYARFSRRRTKRSFAPRALGIAGGVLLLGIGLAQAANLVPASWLGLPGVAPQPSPAVAPSTGVKPSLPEKRSVAPVPLPASAPLRVAPAPSVPPAVTPPATSATSVRRSPAAASAPAPYVDEQWRRAASALRDDDFERARSALLEIERSASLEEGDTARLARAQLLASHGQRDQALALARVLAGQARSSLVRDNARRLVAKLLEEENAQKNRSVEQVPEDKQP
jgi:hypothetical protein